MKKALMTFLESLNILKGNAVLESQKNENGFSLDYVLNLIKNIETEILEISNSLSDNKNETTEKLSNNLLECFDETKEYNGFEHLFTKNPEIKKLQKLNNIIRRILFLILASEMKEVLHPKNNIVRKPLISNTGSLVAIRPVGEEHKNKTFLGLMIGDVPTSSSITVTDNSLQLEYSQYNPAILVPSLNKVIYGYESWWNPIKSEKDLEQITDEDIENSLLVKLFKEINSSEEAQ